MSIAVNGDFAAAIATVAKYFAVAVCIFGMRGAATAISNIFSTALKGIARNNQSAGSMGTYIFVGAAFAEAMGLFSLLVALMLLMK